MIETLRGFAHCSSRHLDVTKRPMIRSYYFQVHPFVPTHVLVQQNQLEHFVKCLKTADPDEYFFRSLVLGCLAGCDQIEEREALLAVMSLYSP